jgi:hypothetical protein
MQTEITTPLPLLNAEGHITREGWARQPLWQYDREAVHAPKWRIKEWDYFSVLSPDQQFGIALTVADLGYIGMAAICFLDFERGTFHQVDTLSLFPMGETGFPAGSDEGTVRFGDKKLQVEFSYSGGQRVLNFSAPGLVNAQGDKGITGSITLEQPAAMESMNIATSWAENRRAFYYNRKVNCMPAQGGFTIGKREYSFAPQRDMGALDWGRGHWTYKNRWYWGSASGHAQGHALGWNIGYGFTDRSPASENMLFVDGVAHKLAEVSFHMDTSDYTRPWRFTSSDQRFEMTFTPIVDRNSSIHLGVIRSAQHQVFGYYSGTVVLDDGRHITVDRFLGFAEDVLNWW